MQTFKKDERLSSKKLIELLFSKGQSFKFHPFRVVWLRLGQPLPAPVQVLISVSKKTFRHAVDRNFIKRRIREAYRCNKLPFYSFLNASNEYCLLALIYTGPRMVSSEEAEQKIILVLNRLQKDYRKQMTAEKDQKEEGLQLNNNG
jgi:ribonuclease P protein component